MGKKSSKPSQPLELPIQEQLKQAHYDALVCEITDKFLSFEHAMREQDDDKRADYLDRIYRANLGMLSTGLSPAALGVAYYDWLAQLALSPNKRLQLLQSAWNLCAKMNKTHLHYVESQTTNCFGIDEKRFQQRFESESWRDWPYCFFAQNFLQLEDWWQEAVTVRGMQQDHRELLAFIFLQWLNAVSPENNVFINPEIREKTQESWGQNFFDGWYNWQKDAWSFLTSQTPVKAEQYEVGRNIACTEGKVVFRNALFELIQYSPQTSSVYPEPILIIPAWIMKYYILDLSPKNSLVKYLVNNGHTVFMISWKNPDASYRNVTMKDYLHMGVLSACDAIEKITGKKQIHAAGYCVGGTLLTIAASYLALKKQNIFKTLTLFAAQTDFDEPGELMTFIDETQLSYLEDIMYTQGYLRGDQMSAAFELLRSKELIWYKGVQRYLLGETDDTTDLLAWNEDTTRLPYKLHSEYLRNFQLENSLVEGKYRIDGNLILLEDIKQPLFVVATAKDHIAPWKSVYKIHLYTKPREITFVLANRGHNGGIVSEPGHKGRSFRLGKLNGDARYKSPDQWYCDHKSQKGSWWRKWHEWLASQSGKKITPPNMGAPNKGLPTLEDAPGIYVKEK